MNIIVYEFLSKTNNNPHKAWDEYIKYYLLSGKQLSEDIKGIQDFIKASKPEQEKKKRKSYTKRIIKPVIKTDNINIQKGIDILKGRINIINEEIQNKKLENNNLSYCSNEWVMYFNSAYDVLQEMNILPNVNTYSLTCMEYTKERINIINQL